MKIVDKVMVFLNSTERDQGTVSDFTISLPQHLLSRKKNQQMRLILNDMNLPYTWYNVQSSNNKFKVYEDDFSATYYECDLLLGSYHVLQLRDHLKQRLDSYSILYGASYIYTVVYDELSAKFKFSAVKEGFEASFSFEFTSTSSHKLMGFEPNSDNPSANQTLESSRAINMMFTDALYLHCDLPTTNVNKSTDGGFKISNVFAKINVNTVPFSNIIYHNVNDDFITNIPDQFINSLNFSIRTLEHNSIDLNDDFSLTLKLEIIEDDERLILKQNSTIMELLRTLLLQQHVKN